MTSSPALLPEPHPVLAGVQELEAVLDRLHAGAEEPLLPHTCAGLVSDLDRIGRRVAALKLRLVARQETAEVASRAGFADTGAWLSRATRTTRGDAARQVRLAERLETAGRTDAAFAAGELSSAHAEVVTGALDLLPDYLSADQRDQVEADLVIKAARFDPAQLRRIARRALEAVEPDPRVVDAHEDDLLRQEEHAAHDRVRLTLHDNEDGTLSGHFTVPVLAGSILRKVLDAMISPRRAHGDPQPADWAVRRGAAFAELLEHLPTDHLHTKTAATVVVQLRHDVLIGALAAAGTDVDEPISAGTARRLACTAGIIPTVLGGASLPLDLGREQRLFSEAQRVALSTRHTACATDGCYRPFAWCELHHRKPWSHGGRTDLDQAVPLCASHHRKIHDPTGRHRAGARGITFWRDASPPG